MEPCTNASFVFIRQYIDYSAIMHSVLDLTKPLYITAGIRITMEPREADVTEDGMGTLNFIRTGFSFGPIRFRVLPLTYDQFVARGFDLDSIHPERPIAADAGTILHIESMGTVVAWLHLCCM